jgi:hypothetical protein
MTSKDLRTQVRQALEGVDGDTRPVQRMVYDLADRLRAAEERLSEVRGELTAQKAVAARERAAAEELQVVVDGLRQGTHNAELARQRLEAELHRLRHPEVDVAAAWENYQRLLPKWIPARLAAADNLLRNYLGHLFTRDPGTFAGASDAEIRTILHAGFSEYQMLSTLSGRGNYFIFQLTNDRT